MELSGILVVTVISLFNSVLCEDYGLTVTPEHIYVKEGDKPEFVCSTSKNAPFLLSNPLKWERVPRKGVQTPVTISSLGNLEPGMNDEFHVDLEQPMSFRLKMVQGVKVNYDGFFRCTLYNKDNVVLATKSVEVHVIHMFEKMSFSLDGQKQTVTGEPSLPIRLEEGSYNPVCTAEQSNPRATVVIDLGGVPLPNPSITDIENKDRLAPPQTYNVQSSAVLKLDPSHTNKILRCIAKVNNDNSLKAEISFKLEVYSIKPEIECRNSSAVNGDRYVELICDLMLKGVKCSDNILWENGDSGEQFKFNQMDSPDNTYKAFCSEHDDNQVQVKLRIDTVKEKDFATEFFVIYINKHGSSIKVPTNLNQDYNGASSLQYAVYLLTSVVLATKILL